MRPLFSMILVLWSNRSIAFSLDLLNIIFRDQRQQNREHMRVILQILIMAILTVSIHPVVAQKSRKKKKGKSKSLVIKALPLTEEENAAIDRYFLDGEKYYLINDLAKATSTFEKVLSLDPNDAASHYKLAQIYSESSKMAEALPHALSAKELRPKNKYYHLLLTHVQTGLGDLPAAEASYIDMLDNVEGTESYLFDLAAIQLYQKNYEGALITYDKAEKHFGTMEEISVQKQQVYLKQNELELAIAEGQKLVKLYPHEPSYALSLAQIMLSNDKFEEAEQFLLDKLDQYQNSEKLYIFLSEAYSKQKKHDLAIEVLQEPFKSPTLDLTRKIRTMAGYLAMLPNEKLNEPLLNLSEILVMTHPTSFQVLGLTGDLNYNLGNKEKALEYYLKAVKIDGSNFSIWQNILSLDLDLERFDAVITHANEALESFPNQASLYYFGGTAYLIQKDYEGALKMFNQGKNYATQDPNLNSLFHGQIGDTYNSLEDHEKSDEAYELALKAKPDNDHVLNNYSYFLTLRKKDLDKALSMSTRLVTDYPDNPTYLDTHAWVLYMRGDFEAAAKYLAHAIKFDASATIIEHYGDALFQLERIDEAIVQWKAARDTAEDTSTLDKKIADKQLYE